MASMVELTEPRVRPLNVLLSAYACEPGKGSEPGIGWRWARNLADSGHKVWVLTRANNRPAIELALAAQPLHGVEFAYYDLPRWACWWKRGGRGVHLYYYLWQWGAYKTARRLQRKQRFDLVHHITFGVFRQPSFMAFLDAPFILDRSVVARARHRHSCVAHVGAVALSTGCGLAPMHS